MTGPKVAAAPISWGVCEVPGWGHQLAPGRVLAEMSTLVAATEFGPAGFLPADPVRRARLLAGYGLAPVGGFVPVLLHEVGHDPRPELKQSLAEFAAAGAEVLVLAAASGRDGYETRPQLSTSDWRVLLANLDRIAALAADHGLTAALHPHVGTLVETPGEVRRVLDGSSVPLCLDTGHLLVGGGDPAELAQGAARRVAHLHLKDVYANLAERVRAGELGYYDAVRTGLYRPLGTGDVDLPGVLTALREAGYAGWYVLEQDTVLAAEPTGEGPVADVRTSLAYLRGVLA